MGSDAFANLVDTSIDITGAVFTLAAFISANQQNNGTVEVINE
jgi:hypothetical protein